MQKKSDPKDSIQSLKSEYSKFKKLFLRHLNTTSFCIAVSFFTLSSEINLYK